MVENYKPSIRFTKFMEDWERRKLGEMLIQYTEITTENNQYPALTSSRKGVFFQTEYFAGHQIASEDNTGYNIVPRGYFTYRHMSDDEIFYFNINNIANFGIVSTLYPVFTTNDKLDSKYLQYQLNNGNEFRRYAVLQKQGGSRTYMYFNKLKNLSLTMPPEVKEQEQISRFLTHLDDLIVLHQRKYDKLVNLKKSMLEKMFPKDGEDMPEIRVKGFIGAWEKHNLSYYLETSQEKNEQLFFSKMDVLSVSGEFGIINQIKHKGRSFAGASVKNYGVVHTGDIVYTKSPLKDTPYGIIKANIGDDGIVSTLYAIYRPQSYTYSPFVQYYFELDERLNRYLKPLVNKGAKNDMKVSSDGALLGNVFFPGFEEQRKIAEFFSEHDALILIRAQELEKLQNLKKALLEKMLV